jgi:hypothetical protein
MADPDHDRYSLDPLQRGRPSTQDERLLSAREAALWLGVNPRTAQLRAGRALRAGVREVRTIAGAYWAPVWWWQQLLAQPIKPGRPRHNEP